MHLSSKRVAFMVGGLILALSFLATPVTHADETNLSTRFQINHSFQVPGAVLQPNTEYVIRRLDFTSFRDVVQIYNSDQDHLITQFLAISAQQMEPRDKTVFNFMEVDPGYAMPIKQWFYPGRTIGFEFIYPESQLTEIAAHSNGRSITTAVARVEPAPPVTEERQEAVVEPVQEAPAPAIAENQAPVEEAAPAPEEPAVTQTASNELPRTAGELPLLALAGMLCFGVGLSLKVFSARS